MPSAIFDGLLLLDPLGLAILGTTVTSLLAAVATHVVLRAWYVAIERDLRQNGESGPRFSHPMLNHIVRDAEEAARRSSDRNTQAIIEDNMQSGLRGLLVAERFVRASTSLVLVLGLLGTFYGLTLSIGKLVHLVSTDSGGVADVAQAVTHGLTNALTGMAVAFSNSLVGIASAVVLTVLGVVNNIADRRTALMIQIEVYVDRWLSSRAPTRANPGDPVAGFSESVMRLEGAVARFDAALQTFAANTKDLREVQLVVALKPGPGR
jgi:hypothetical protein